VKTVGYILLLIAAILGAVILYSVYQNLFAPESSGNMAPDFELEALNGTKIKLSNLRGYVVILDFWATWCKPCRQEMPILGKIYDTYSSKGVVILSINIQESKGTVAAFAQAYKINWTILLDVNGNIASKYKIKYIPTLIIIDKNGCIKHKHIGVTQYNVLASEIDSLLKG